MGNEVSDRSGGIQVNIKRAKEEIKQTVAAYLKKDSYGEYAIPVASQRPILLIGPPGIGKTAIMEQVARECQIGLVSYTITHHTRQSAIGLPYIQKKQYGNQEYSVTEYTMSEIIASVYNKIEETGQKEGILFIDEINCVSETLAATMLQFLQNKSFGPHKVPEGYLIVAAGNPPEYNKSVKEFDIVTLDRVRKLEVTQDYSVWKEYASKQRVHNAILTYLEIKKEHFYQIETTVDGKTFVTARGWEDLSRLLYAYEELDYEVDEAVIYQYLQQRIVAKEFANYYDLYQKYQEHYNIVELLEGRRKKEVLQNMQAASFDERLSVISLMLSKLYESFQRVLEQDAFVSKAYEVLKEIKEELNQGEEIQVVDVLRQKIEKQTAKYEKRYKANMLDKKEAKVERDVVTMLEQMKHEIEGKQIRSQEALEEMKRIFAVHTTKRTEAIEQATSYLKNGFAVMEEAFLNTQEMVIFITELTMNYYAGKYISEYGCEKYYQYNQEILLTNKRSDLLKEIEQIVG